MNINFTKSPIFIYLVLVCVSTISALILFQFGDSMAEVTGHPDKAFSFQAGGAIAGFLIVFWLSTRVIVRLYGIKSLSSKELNYLDELQIFRKKIEGCWWQKLTPNIPCALSFITITPQNAAYSLKIDGWAYDLRGKYVAKFVSESGFVDLNEKCIFYAWKRKGSKPYEGFGQIDFVEVEGKYKVSGFFLDMNYNDLKETKLFETEYWRANEDDLDLMLGDDKESSKGSISERIKEKLT